ncbi:amino acid transporter [Artomyces pyxidatus]|uniref:Amino acid transporter n=1 Tax=Artomyces pyxidatus TaxID=48021 RepID=A0ACB8SK46_9AGAM|nr:amino acid transporter [Artomyces pyxidatus]
MASPSRTTLFLGLLAGGPAAVWSSVLIAMVFMSITALVLAEICSALPLSGSIYIWAAESAGPKYARFFGFVVASWSTSAWITFAAVISQSTANYVVSQFAVWEIDFPGGITNDNVKWRTLIWAMSEGFLILSVAINYLPPKAYSGVVKFSVAIIIVDFLLNVIWLPIAVHNTYGFRSAKDVFTMTYNGTGATPGWNWMLSFFFAANVFVGFDASGHVAEETKHANVIAGRGLLTSVLATAVLGFATTILFLFCTPDLDTVFALNAPQPFIQIYALALGKGPSIFMTAIAAINNFTVDKDGQPRNAVTVVFGFSAALLCTILPSQVAFTSLLSAGGVQMIASYGLIPMLRFTMTPGMFKSSHFYLGKLALPLYAMSVVWNALLFVVLISPFFFPVNAQNFNFACVIFGFVTTFGIVSWWFTPPEKWLRQEQIEQALRSAGLQNAIVPVIAVEVTSSKKEA